MGIISHNLNQGLTVPPRRERSKNHIDSIRRTDNILIITHGIVIEFIHKHLTGEKLNKVKELSGISLTGGIVKEFEIRV